MGITPWELAFLLLLVAVLLGVVRLVQVGSAIGRSSRSASTVVHQEPVAATPSVPPVICAACQATNVGTNKFCSVCGATLAVQAHASPAVEAAASEELAADTPSALEGGPPAAAHTSGSTVPNNTCPSCATLNPPGQPFCGQCGTSLTTQAA